MYRLRLAAVFPSGHLFLQFLPIVSYFASIREPRQGHTITLFGKLQSLNQDESHLKRVRVPVRVAGFFFHKSPADADRRSSLVSCSARTRRLLGGPDCSIGTRSFGLLHLNVGMFSDVPQRNYEHASCDIVFMIS